MDSPAQSLPAETQPTLLGHPTVRRWWLRIRIAAVALAGWWVMRHWADVYVVPVGFERPLVLFGSEGGIGGALTACAMLLAIGWAGAQLAWIRSGSAPLVIVCLILAAWATRGGVMDDWLAIQNPKPGRGTAGPYLALLPDYVLLIVMVVTAAWLGGYQGRIVAAGTNRMSALFGLDQTAAERARGLKGFAAGVAASAAILFIACGPPRGETLRGQVYFAMYVAGYLGALAAGRVSDGPQAARGRAANPSERAPVSSERAPSERTPIWYLSIPLAVGVIGILLAAARPVLSPPFELINTIPPWWGLVRPLPVEAVAVGVLGVLHGLVTLRRWDAHHAG